jgi:hypothetical protein
VYGPEELPDKPSIAVLPFQNMSGDPEQEYFADGMVEDMEGGGVCICTCAAWGTENVADALVPLVPRDNEPTTRQAAAWQQAG